MRLDFADMTDRLNPPERSYTTWIRDVRKKPVNSAYMKDFSRRTAWTLQVSEDGKAAITWEKICDDRPFLRDYYKNLKVKVAFEV